MRIIISCLTLTGLMILSVKAQKDNLLSGYPDHDIPVTSIIENIPDSTLLEIVQRQTFRFFWHGAHPSRIAAGAPEGHYIPLHIARNGKQFAYTSGRGCEPRRKGRACRTRRINMKPNSATIFTIAGLALGLAGSAIAACSSCLAPPRFSASRSPSSGRGRAPRCAA